MIWLVAFLLAFSLFMTQVLAHYYIRLKDLERSLKPCHKHTHLLGNKVRQWCENPNEHSEHKHEIIQNYICSGRTHCGVPAHREHEFEDVRVVLCPGICSCGDPYLGVHGPGTHTKTRRPRPGNSGVV